MTLLIPVPDRPAAGQYHARRALPDGGRRRTDRRRRIDRGLLHHELPLRDREPLRATAALVAGLCWAGRGSLFREGLHGQLRGHHPDGHRHRCRDSPAPPDERGGAGKVPVRSYDRARGPLSAATVLSFASSRRPRRRPLAGPDDCVGSEPRHRGCVHRSTPGVDDDLACATSPSTTGRIRRSDAENLLDQRRRSCGRRGRRVDVDVGSLDLDSTHGMSDTVRDDPKGAYCTHALITPALRQRDRTGTEMGIDGGGVNRLIRDGRRDRSR